MIQPHQLTPHLPHGVFVLRPDGHTMLKIEGFELPDNLIFRETQGRTYGDLRCTDNKLILYPLSDLIKEIEQNGKKFVPAEILYNDSAGDLNLFENKQRVIRGLLYWVIEKLLEWHFDVDGLIDKGLAVDVNTLPKNPYK